MATTACPACAGEMDPDDVLWLVHLKFYCSEKCAAGAAKSNG